MTSQTAAYTVLDSVITKILHAHSFARMSTQASSVFSNLLARYLTLVASSCGRYAEHSGRSELSIHDLVACLDEIGTNVDELREYCATEGVELSKYASSSAKRLDDLADLQGYLEEGLDRSNVPIPLLYAPMPEDEPLMDMEDEDSSEDDYVAMDNADMPVEKTTEPFRWRADSPHIPDFLPPFPDASRHPSPSPTPLAHPVKMERPSSPITQHITSSTAADYVTQVPYSDSVLATTPQWHLPTPPSSFPASRAQAPRFPTPPTQPALFSAYHHILTHPVKDTPPPNPAKHKVAMALLSQMQNNTRWDAPDTLFASIVPCPPRVAPIGPSYAIAHSTLADWRAGKDIEREMERKSAVPSAPPRPVFSNDKQAFLPSQQGSRLPELARQVLPGPVLARTSRLTHPPILQRGNQKLLYGSGIGAPWNSTSSGPGGKAADDGITMANGRGAEAPAFTLPDAQMFATWDYEVKHFYEPLGRRGRTSSNVPSGGPTLSLSLGRPSKAT